MTIQSYYAQEKNGFDLSTAAIPISEIKDGGPPKDGIPSIDNPILLNASEVSLSTNDRILGVYENGIAKAYPIAILNYHEVVNDNFGDKAVVVTYCPLCGSGIAFDAKVNDKTHTFGVSGLLYNSDVLLYDRQTESLWSQLKYEAVSGSMLGNELKILNTANTTWGNWKQRHPKSLVMSENTGFIRDYTRNPYPGNDTSKRTYFPVNQEDDRFHPKEMVIGIEINKQTKAYLFSELEKLEGKVLEDTFEGQKLRVKYNREVQSAEIVDAQGNLLPGITNFWFAWFAFNPDTEVYQHKM